MLHLWSLAVEEQFYIVWPFVLWLAWKLKFNLLTVTVAVAVVSLYLNLHFVHTHPVETFYWPIGRFWELLSGSILAWIFLYKAEEIKNIKLWIDRKFKGLIKSKDVSADGSIVYNLFSFIGILALVYGVIFIDENLVFPSAWAIIPVAGATLVIIGGSKAWFNQLLLMNPIAVWFGLISYPLYLWHWPILSFMQIIEGDMPHRDNRIVAVLLSVFLAWLTYKWIEAPIRFGFLKKKLNAFIIAFILFAVGGLGYYINITDRTNFKRHENVFLQRGFEHAIGTSTKWYKGQDDWLFLGNDIDNTVAKLKLAILPPADYIEKVSSQFSKLAKKASELNIKTALLVGPNKSSVYREFLPTELIPASVRYSTYITEELRKIPQLETVDPTEILIENKLKEGVLYWRTDSHWNQKGAYVSFRFLMESLHLKCPDVKFTEGTPYKGDILTNRNLMNIEIKDFPVHSNDNWDFQILSDCEIVREEFHNESKKNTFGWLGTTRNNNALNDLKVWVIGDSFTSALRPFIEASFKEVKYIGHWSNKLDSLDAELANSKEKPDLVFVVRVERSF